MNARANYAPGAANADVQKEGDQWTLVLVRQLEHSPEKVWQALTDPKHLREWAPFDVDGSMDAAGSVKLTWVGSDKPIDTRITRAEKPTLLEYNDTRWVLQPVDGGTRLTLWASIDRRFISMGAAGWHISLDVLDHMLSGTPIGRIAGKEAMQFDGWQRLNAEYAKQFGVQLPRW